MTRIIMQLIYATVAVSILGLLREPDDILRERLCVVIGDKQIGPLKTINGGVVSQLAAPTGSLPRRRCVVLP